MTATVKKLQRKPSPVEALLNTGHNEKEVEEFLGDRFVYYVESDDVRRGFCCFDVRRYSDNGTTVEDVVSGYCNAGNYLVKSYDDFGNTVFQHLAPSRLAKHYEGLEVSE